MPLDKFGKRRVAAAVVDGDYLPGPPSGREGRDQFGREPVDHLLLVVDRSHYGKQEVVGMRHGGGLGYGLRGGYCGDHVTHSITMTV